MNNKDLLRGLAISVACETLVVKKVYEENPELPSIDILDNEWPIEWKMSEVAGNSNSFADGETTVCYVSNLAPTLEEINAMIVTAMVDGNSVNFMMLNSETVDGCISATFIDSNSGNGMIALSVNSVQSLQDNTAQATGLYVSTVQTGDYEGLDIAFTLTKGGT